MGIKKNTAKIMEELTNNLQYVNEDELESLTDAILQTKYIFTAGVGRSGLAVKAFTNRLMHLGLSVYNVGEISCPHTQPGDLLLIASGSGETESLTVLAKQAKKNGMKVALITTDVTSTIAQMSDVVVVLPGVSPKWKNKENSFSSIQPMASAFEQLCLLICDGIVMELMDRMNETSDSMFVRHADLE